MTESAVQDDFLPLAEPYRRELLAHCYRMLGSVHDAEDLVQETYLRAWRAYDRFEGRVVAAHLALPDRHERLSDRAGEPEPPTAAQRSRRAELRPGRRAGPATEVPWLEPIPDAMVARRRPTRRPSSASRESIRLALIAALQHLPPRQRAVLILCEVLQWPAAEVAEMLDVTTAAVNSALQRARAQISEVAPAEDAVPSRTTRGAARAARPVRGGVRALRRQRARHAVHRGRGLGDAAVHRLVPGRPRTSAGWSTTSARPEGPATSTARRRRRTASRRSACTCAATTTYRPFQLHVLT